MSAQNITSHPVARPLALIAGILLIAASLRAPVTGVAPVLSMIQRAFGLDAAQAGLLTTLPLLAFAVISPFSGLFARRWGLERTLFAALAVITVGIGLRSAGPAWSLYLGTAILGSGIAVGNVLLPSLLKRDFPQRIAILTGAYAVTMGVAAGLTSALAVPLSLMTQAGWPLALGVVMILPAAAMFWWIPQLRNHIAANRAATTTSKSSAVWRAALAWQVTLFMGLNSFLYYILVSWLPAILSHNGYSAAEAGSLHGLMQLAGAVPGLMLAPFVSRMKDQKTIAVCMSLMTTTGLLGLLLFPAWSTLWVVFFGAGTGAGIILGLIFMGLRASSARQAAALSGMAQSVGYSLAAAGPPLVGMLHDRSGDWTMPLAGCALLSLMMAFFGRLAGRARTIQ